MNITSKGFGYVATDCKAKTDTFFVQFTISFDLGEGLKEPSELGLTHTHTRICHRNF
jgi:hypothetical protein